MNPIDRAFTMQQGIKFHVLMENFPIIEAELLEARGLARKLWAELCRREGFKPEDLMKREALMVSDENEDLSKDYQFASRLLLKKIRRYKEACEILGREPIILLETHNRFMSKKQAAPPPPERRKRRRV